MSTKQKQNKLDKRAAALRDNLKKRKSASTSKNDTKSKETKDSK